MIKVTKIWRNKFTDEIMVELYDVNDRTYQTHTLGYIFESIDKGFMKINNIKVDGLGNLFMNVN